MAMVELASGASTDTSLSLSRIAEEQHISVAYLEQLFIKLRRAGLVESVRGRSGGYRLGRPADEITVFEVMAAVAEGTDMTRCGNGAGEPCMVGQRCRAHDLWQALGQHIDTFLQRVTLQDVLDGALPREFGPSTRQQRRVPALQDGGGE